MLMMKTSPIHLSKRTVNQGFTLIELMIAVAIVGITTTVAVPSLVSIVDEQKLTTQANDMVASLNLARSAAIKRRQTVTIAKKTHWENGWDIFVDIDNDNVKDPQDILIKSLPALSTGSVTITGTTSFASYISYYPNGRPNGAGSFSFCPSNTLDSSRKVTIANTGRIRTTSSDYATNCS
jgi:type IV fimbrial biogenesis protein FimT